MLRLGLGFIFYITLFLPNLLHSCHGLLLCHKWRMNKFSNFKIHRRIYTAFRETLDGAGCLYFFGEKRTLIVLLKLKIISCSAA